MLRPDLTVQPCEDGCDHLQLRLMLTPAQTERWFEIVATAEQDDHLHVRVSAGPDGLGMDAVAIDGACEDPDRNPTLVLAVPGNLLADLCDGGGDAIGVILALHLDGGDVAYASVAVEAFPYLSEAHGAPAAI